MDLIVQAIVSVILFLYPSIKILKRAGLNPGLGAFVVIPGLGLLIVALILIFSDWNVQSTERNIS